MDGCTDGWTHEWMDACLPCRSKHAQICFFSGFLAIKSMSRNSARDMVCFGSTQCPRNTECNLYAYLLVSKLKTNSTFRQA